LEILNFLLYFYFYFIITVIAPLNSRIKRIIERDMVTPEQVKERIENQLPDEEKILKSDFIINNDEKNSIVEQVLFIHNLLLSKFNL